MFNTAHATNVTLTKANLEDVLKASLIAGEALEKVANAKRGMLICFFPCSIDSESPYLPQGDTSLDSRV